MQEYELGWNRTDKEQTKYNVHVFCHSMEVRQGPSYLTSAERFESAYFTMKKMFAVGTRNVPKQLIWKYMLRDIVHHECGLSPWSQVIKSTGSELTKVEDNSLITIDESNGGIGFVRVHDHCEHNTWFRVSRVKTGVFQGQESLNLLLPWEKVGVMAYCGETEEQFDVTPKVIRGKAIIVRESICEMKPEWFQSRLQA